MILDFKRADDGLDKAARNTRIEAMRAVDGLGVFYWEPDANRAAVPDGYPLGAARLVDAHTLQYTSALDAFRRA